MIAFWLKLNGERFELRAMPSSTVTVAKRALVSLLLRLAVAYHVVIAVNRDSADRVVTDAYKKVILKAHPDKGGRTKDFQSLQDAKETWVNATREANANQKKGRPKEDHNEGGRKAPRKKSDHWPLDVDLPNADKSQKQYRIQSVFVLLTYFGINDIALWPRFCDHVSKSRKKTRKSGSMHIHLALQFVRKVDRSSRFFSFEDLQPPRADLGDFLGGGVNRKKMQMSVNRCMFYCFADKIGTVRDGQGKVCTAGNYYPCWTPDVTLTYPVPGRWPEALWKAHKLDHKTYESYLFLCRDGVLAKKRNLQAVREWEEATEEAEEMAAVVKRIRGTFQFSKIPEVKAWLEKFKVEADRYPFLLLLAKSLAGKTEFAKSLFKFPLELKVGKLEHFPDSMRAFDRKVHDAIILDDVRNLDFLIQNQEKIQSKYDARIEFGSTPGGQCAFDKWRWKVLIVVTASFSTSGLDLLEKDDFLSNPGNRVVVRLEASTRS